MSESAFQVLLGGRGGGKTTAAVAWVAEGKRLPGYPGWDRVLVIAHRPAWESLRRRLWGELEDFDHRVYEAAAWREARGVHPATEVRLDDAQALLPWLPGRLTGITLCGATWEAEVADAAGAGEAVVDFSCGRCGAGWTGVPDAVRAYADSCPECPRTDPPSVEVEPRLSVALTDEQRELVGDALGFLFQSAPGRRDELVALAKETGLDLVVDGG